MKEARDARGGPKSPEPTSFSGSAPPSFPRTPWALRNGNKGDYLKCTSFSFPQCDLGCHTVLSGALGLCCSLTFRTRTSDACPPPAGTRVYTHLQTPASALAEPQPQMPAYIPRAGAPEIIIKACTRRKAGRHAGIWESTSFSITLIYLLPQPELCWLKKDAQYESLELRFIGGKVRTAAREIAAQRALRNYSKEVVGEDSIHVILIKG